MSEPVVKRHNVTFSQGLPLGVHASFTHEGRHWIAVPADKYTQIVTVSDRLLGVIAHARDQLTAWVGVEPRVAARVVAVLNTLARAEGADIEKVQVQTS